jgi:hypothetical protein
MKNNITSNIDLLEILKKANIKINGVYTKDQLKAPLKEGFYIINFTTTICNNIYIV